MQDGHAEEIRRKTFETGDVWVLDKNCMRPECIEWNRLGERARISKRGVWSGRDFTQDARYGILAQSREEGEKAMTGATSWRNWPNCEGLCSKPLTQPFK